MKITLTARNRDAACDAIRNCDDGYVVEIKKPGRNLDQNAALHAVLSDIANSGLPFAGKPRTMAEWKVLMVSGHARVMGDNLEVVQGIEGEPVALRESTARMSKDRMASLIEYTVAWAVQNGIRLRAPASYEQYQR